MDGTLIHRKLAPSKRCYSIYRPRREGKLSQLRGKLKEIHKNIQNIAEPGIERGYLDMILVPRAQRFSQQAAKGDDYDGDDDDDDDSDDDDDDSDDDDDDDGDSDDDDDDTIIP